MWAVDGYRPLSVGNTGGGIAGRGAGRDEVAPISVNDRARDAVDLVYASTTWRVGRLVVGPLIAARRVLGLGAARPQVRLRIDSLWPSVSGTARARGRSDRTVHLSLMIGQVEASRQAIAVPGRTRGDRSSVEFAIPYPIRPHTLDLGSVRLEERPEPFARRRRGMARGVRRDVRQIAPETVADATVRRVVGDEETLRTAAAAGDQVAIVSTYRPPGRSAAHLVGLLGALRQSGFRIVLVDTSDESFTDGELVDLAVHRHNSGWDFGSWVVALRRFPWLQTDPGRLLLVNDSCYGPIQGLDETFAAGRRLAADVWGLTDSWDHEHHLQSYFLVLERSALSSGALSRFVEAYGFPAAKDDIIRDAEVALTRHLRSEGLSVAAVFEFERLAREFLTGFGDRSKEILALPENQLRVDLGLSGDIHELRYALHVADAIGRMIPLNPTHYFWDTLLDLGFPFVKRELVLKNPMGIPIHRALRSKIADEGVYAMIESDIRASQARSA